MVVPYERCLRHWWGSDAGTKLSYLVVKVQIRKLHGSLGYGDGGRPSQFECQSILYYALNFYINKLKSLDSISEKSLIEI